MSESVEEVVTTADRIAAAPERRVARSTSRVSEDIVEGDGIVRADSGDGDDDDVIFDGPARRKLSESARKLLENLDTDGGDDPIDDPPPAETKPADAPTEAKPVEEKKPDAPAAADPELQGRHDRLLKRNQELLSELDGYRKRGGKAELSEREKALDEADRGYLDDSVASVRKLVATSLGVAHDSKEAEEELLHLYNDLTEKLFSVDLDPSKKALRQAARTKYILARDKRERAAEREQAAKPQGDGGPPAEAISFIGDQVTKIASKYPLLTSLAEDFDGMQPSHLLFTEIGKRINLGEFEADTPGDKLVEMAAAKIESRYKAIADKLGKATTNNNTAQNASTETPTNAQDAKASPSQGADQKPGVRSVTNAQASVAPATPPAKKPDVTPQDAPPKFTSEAQRRRWLAQKHLGAT